MAPSRAFHTSRRINPSTVLASACRFLIALTLQRQSVSDAGKAYALLSSEGDGIDDFSSCADARGSDLWRICKCIEAVALSSLHWRQALRHISKAGTSSLSRESNHSFPLSSSVSILFLSQSFITSSTKSSSISRLHIGQTGSRSSLNHLPRQAL